MKRKYIYTNKKHPQKAIAATILGTISLLSMIAVIFLSYQTGGATIAGYGLTGFFSAVFTLVGFVLSVLALKEKDTFKFFGILGLLLNIFVLTGVGFIVYMGMM